MYASASITGLSTRTSTIGTCGGCSPTREDSPGTITAARFISRIRRDVRRRVADWTGLYQYTVDKVIEDMIKRCHELGLRLARPEEEAKHEFTVLLTVQTMNYLHSGRHRVAL